jgi:hypothetical protein
MLRMRVIFPRKTQKAQTGGAVFNFIRKFQDFNRLFSCVSCFSWTIKAICVTSANFLSEINFIILFIAVAQTVALNQLKFLAVKLNLSTNLASFV